MELQSLMIAILAWMVPYVGYETTVEPPTVEIVSQQRLEELGRGNIPGTILLAVYDGKKKTMYLNTKFDPANFDHQAVLAHELRHHLQFIYDDPYRNCVREYEKDGYRIHNLWYSTHGRPEPHPSWLGVMMAVCPAEKD